MKWTPEKQKLDDAIAQDIMQNNKFDVLHYFFPETKDMVAYSNAVYPYPYRRNSVLALLVQAENLDLFHHFFDTYFSNHSDNDSWKSINGRFKYEIKEIEEVDYETVCKYSRAYRNNKALIVSGFAGVGKTRFTELYKSIYDIIDLDSSYYSWIINEDGTKEKDPNFVANYSQAISELEGYADIIFISTHEDVRKRLKERDIPFITVGPKREAKDQWIERLKKRNPDDRIIPIMEENWDSFLDTLNLDNGLTGKMAIKLNGDQYLDPSWVGPIRNIVIGEPLVIDFGKWG